MAGSLIAAYKNGSASATDPSQLAADFQNWNAIMQESGTLMSRYLVSQGFSSQEANYYSEFRSQGVLPSADPNASSSLAQVQAAQYAQKLDQFAQNYVATKSTYAPTDGQMQDMIVQVLNDSWTRISQDIALSALNASNAAHSSSGQAASSHQ